MRHWAVLTSAGTVELDRKLVEAAEDGHFVLALDPDGEKRGRMKPKRRTRSSSRGWWWQWVPLSFSAAPRVLLTA